MDLLVSRLLVLGFVVANCFFLLAVVVAVAILFALVWFVMVSAVVIVSTVIVLFVVAISGVIFLLFRNYVFLLPAGDK